MESFNPQEVADTLHPLERKILPLISSCVTDKCLIEKSGLKEVEVARALQWLSNKKLIVLEHTRKEIISLDKNGVSYSKKGLPEKRFLSVLSKKGEVILEDIGKEAGLEKDELNLCIGLLKKKVAINVRKADGLLISITARGKEIMKKGSLEDSFLSLRFPIRLDKLSEEQIYAFEELKKRKQIIRVIEEKTYKVKLTEKGRITASLNLSEDTIDALTPQIIKTGEWKKRQFRKYDVSINVPEINGGRRHPVNQAIEYIRNIWLELGFTEMKGPHVMTSFWDMDALFVPQDHPAREEQDTFFLKDPKYGSLPPQWKKVKQTHENGGDTGSKGWGGKWDRDVARENLLITHDTYLSGKVIASTSKEDLPVKTFQIMKVFRNEALDWKHLFEFYQVGGIVINPDVNFSHLIGYLKTFFKKMGFDKVRIRPAHFPYTEPSAEIEVFHPEKKQWIELGGSGMFRPELVEPLLGFSCPVLAWGFGLERILTDYYDIKALRDLYDNDLKMLKEKKQWMK